MTQPARAKLAALLAAPLFVSSIAGCSATTASDPAPVASETVTTPAAEPVTPETVDLTGEWKFIVPDGDGGFGGTVTEDSIMVGILNMTTDTTALYWVGTIDVPEGRSTFSFTSEGDRAQLDKALLGSGDDTKEFVYDGTSLTFDFTIQGQTVPISLVRAD